MKYNNYYNRTVKKLDTVSDYYNTYNAVIKENVNFNSNDSVNTTLTVNWDLDWTPDYVLVEDPNNNTFTRWFILDSIRLRGKQYQMTLRHDLVADNLEAILDADCFIEKAIIGEDNPLIYNKENSTVNQIKTDEYTLKDDTKCAWIIGYFGDKPEDYADSNEDIIMHGEYTDTIAYDYTVNSSLNDWEYKNGAVVSDSYAIYSSLHSRYYSQNDNATAVYFTRFTEDWTNTGIYNKVNLASRDAATNYLRSKIITTDIAETNIQASYINTNYTTYPSGGVIGSIFLNRADNIISTLHNYDTFISTATANNDIRKLNNKRVKFVKSNGDVEYYILNVTESKLPSKWIFVNKNTNISLWEHLYFGFNEYANSSAVDANTTFYVEIAKTKLNITFSKLRSGKYYVDMHTGRHKLLDAPYRMFCMPYSVDETVYIKNTGSGISLLEQNKNISLHMASALAKKYHGSGQIYDIQILPYCPIFSIQTSNGIDIRNDVDIYDVIYYKEGTNEPEPVGYILYPEYSSFTLNIPFNKLPLTNVKMSNETDMIRISSPNYNGQFEFNIAKNGGLEYFNVDCTYLPYQPYIHVNPNFGELYGRDFNDARGLICGGDFSIAMVNNAWETYQIQNKNYQNIFDREIQNMEVTQKIERQKGLFNAATNVVQGGVSGAMAGAKGGPWGAVAGAVVGTAASTAGAAIDYQMAETLRTEALDYKSDMFGYQLGNIKALPQSISRTTAFTYNNKYFPIVEYYTCSEIEKRAIANKIAYNSMTVMAIGKLKDYVGNTWEYDDIISKGYIKGSIIRIEELNDDFHVANTISEEIYKGVYL